MSGISATTNVPLSSLFDLSHLGWTSIIHPGQKIKLASEPLPAAAPSPVVTSIPIYTVVKGDTLAKISGKTGVSVATLFNLNRFGWMTIVYPGQGIKLPDTPVKTGAADPPTPAAATSPESVAAVKDMITAAAAKYGVSSTLALAIADQESSFQPQAVSYLGALGVMQIMPSNQTWLSDLAGRPLDLHQTADNIAAGVVLLRMLIQTSPSMSTAIAGYFQGQTSVARYGMYQETRQYVAQVTAKMATY
ncbi:MAG: transglycosylase SLT domain-containing protein [Acidobacteria bacterium]|nr:transglycosylase SLT domain-containing protein [Acidobacteriota bacterium]